MAPLHPPGDRSDRREWERRVICAELNKRRVNEALDRGRGDQPEGAFICECGRVGCNAVLQLTMEQYERVRTGFERFLIARGHEIPGIDQVAETHRQYAVAVKCPATSALIDDEDCRGSA